MENTITQSEEEEKSDFTINHPIFLDRVTVLAMSDSIGGIIQPVNPHFPGFNTVIDVVDEDPDVLWIPNPGFVAIPIATEEALPLIFTDIAAINVAPERTPSTDDERPADSYSLLDRRRYRAQPSSATDCNTPVPLAIGSRLNGNEDIDSTAIEESILVRTPDSRSLCHSSSEGEGDETITRRRKKRKNKANFEGSVGKLKKHHKRDDHDDSGANLPPRRIMSGRRHSGLRQRS
jgi:hypothetical protein